MYPFRRTNRWKRSVQGALLGFGGPLGWLALQLLAGHPVAGQLGSQVGLYAYMLLGTVLAFGLFGFRIGTDEDALRYESVTDALTGLKNVRYFKERINEEMKRARRGGNHFSLLIMDIDHFKRVNDKHGHPAGDKILHFLAGILASKVRTQDVVARVGGEEFAVMLPDTPPEKAMELAQRLRKAVEKSHFKVSETQVLRVTISVGLASAVASRATKAEGYYASADRALFQAKHHGRNRVEQENRVRAA